MKSSLVETIAMAINRIELVDHKRVKVL